MLQGKKVLVTGAGGFIGSRLCGELVRTGAEVTAMIRYSSHGSWGNLEHLPADVLDGIEVVAGYVEDSHFMDRQVKDKDVVFHLAALIGIPYSYVAPQSYVTTNVTGTLNILEACRNTGAVMIHTSTSEVYGTARYTPIDEAHPFQGQSPYSASKIGADKLAESYFKAFEVPVATVRPFNTFGPAQSMRAVIPSIIVQALHRDRIHLGSLTPVRDLTYVTDTARGFIKAAGTKEALGKTINLGVGQGIAIGDLAQRILHLMDSDKPVVTDEERIRPVASEVMELISDNRLAAEVMGWSPEFTLDEGLTETIEFIKAHPGLYKPDIYAV